MAEKNLIDRIIDYLAPTWGTKRVRQRAITKILLQYEGARMDRRAGQWWTQDTSANSEIGPSLSRLRQRSRELNRNNPYATRIINEIVSNAIGTGILSQILINGQKAAADDPLALQIKTARDRWYEECDSEGQNNFHGVQRLVCREIVEAGECLIRYRPRFPTDKFYVPLQLQVLEPDYLDHNRTEVLKNGNRIIQGVEFDQIGRRVAYWLFPEHPGELLVNYQVINMRSERVDALWVEHIYQKDRLQQVRGVPWLTPVLMKLKDLEDYSEAEIVRKKIEACFGAFVTQDEGDAGPILGTEEKNEDHETVETFTPGMVKYLRPGEDVKFSEPAGGGAGFRDFMVDTKTTIASGVGLTYEQMTGDLSNVNYSSYKAGQLSFRNHMDSFRWNTFIPLFCNRVWRRFIDMAFAAGRISRAEYGVAWHPPSYGSVDPEKDAKATIYRIRNGISTWPQEVAQQGYNPDEQLDEMQRTNEDWDTRGIILDCDPRNRTASGNAINQAKAPAQEEGDGKTGGEKDGNN